MKKIVVVGSGLAGYTLVRELRKLNREIPVTQVSRDSGDYYSKPMLSNALALGKDAQSLILTRAADMAKQFNVNLLAHCEVSAIDTSAKQLVTTNGIVDYDRLVLALGADPICIPLQGDASDTVLSVNDLTGYAHLRELLGVAKCIAIMGAGLIGCEFANDLAAAGYAVSVIDPGSGPLAGLMPEQAGAQLQAALSGQGVSWYFGVVVRSVDLASRGYALALSDGSTVYADLVLSAVGLRPHIQLAKQAGLDVNRGIRVNAQLQTSDPSIFALGDCAEIEGRVLPYVLPIMHGGRVLAKVLNGEDARVVFPPMPVVVKTPAHPVVVSPVARDAAGSWQRLAAGQGVKLGFYDEQNNLRGFVLTGEYAGERSEMTGKLTGQVQGATR
jgi:rubredoxin-NAD+ reductase